ncbi:hypothetical protein PsexTeo8_42620 [Pseudomonas extremaustralis]|uniref:phage tail protein n=1 Tax=Pseudomonas extremaustralis TaxID=359110 RepID=UPI002AA0E335|nr:tail fiber protein [Pseudomonas extremaustralis]MDY7067770.1 hypothetical protein [Pseudomonas extremaustralis]
MDYPKSVPNVGLVSGKFVDENTSTGQVGSLIPATWGSAVTDEILNVIMGGGYVPDENENGQLLQAIKEIIADNIPPEKVRTTLAEYGITDAYTKAVTYTKDEIEAKLKNLSALPVGSLICFPVDKVAPGFLEIDGSVKSAAAYPDLATFLDGAFNKGDEGAGNFRLPESRGEFLRGWDHGRGVDAGRVMGSYQADMFKSHTHGAKVNQGAAGGGFTTIYSTGTQNNSETYIQAEGGAETRPRNLAVMWCIKAWNAPINQGNIDIAALVPLAGLTTEANQGTAKVSSLAQVNAGADDATIVTPKKLKSGVSYLFAKNGYVTFPTWLGGLIIQWGTVPLNDDSITDVTLPISFPNTFFSAHATVQHSAAQGGGTASSALTFKKSLSVVSVAVADTGNPGVRDVDYFCVGR